MKNIFATLPFAAVFAFMLPVTQQKRVRWFGNLGISCELIGFVLALFQQSLLAHVFFLSGHILLLNFICEFLKARGNLHIIVPIGVAILILTFESRLVGLMFAIAFLSTVIFWLFLTAKIEYPTKAILLLFFGLITVEDIISSIAALFQLSFYSEWVLGIEIVTWLLMFGIIINNFLRLQTDLPSHLWRNEYVAMNPNRVLSTKDIIKQLERLTVKLNVPPPSFPSFDKLGVCFLDEKGDFLLVDKTWEAITGIPKNVILHKSWMDIILPQDHSRIVNEWQIAQKQKRDFVTQYQIKGSNADKMIMTRVAKVANGYIAILLEIGQ